jgi:hypothetical protein
VTDRYQPDFVGIATVSHSEQPVVDGIRHHDKTTVNALASNKIQLFITHEHDDRRLTHDLFQDCATRAGELAIAQQSRAVFGVDELEPQSFCQTRDGTRPGIKVGVQ